ncbi:MAG: DUF4388 domain-containing protein [Myxococcales bacterium]|nr:MAG: DUF4388 domain-containing protein [Myxococcales bacterium]
MPSHILIVESNQTIRKAMSNTLTRAGYSISHAETIDKTASFLKNNPSVQLVFADVQTLGGEREFLKDFSHVFQAHPSVEWILTHFSSMRVPQKIQKPNLRCLEKPFSPETVLKQSSKYVQSSLGNDEIAVSGDETEDISPLDESGYAKSTQWLQEQSVVLNAWVERLSEGLTPIIRTLQTPSELTPRVFSTALQQTLGEKQLQALSHDLSRLSPTAKGLASLEGRIDHAPLIETLQMLQMQNQTGTLNIRKNDRVIHVCLSNGAVDMAVSEGSSPEFLLGRYLIEKGFIRRDELEGLLNDNNDELEQLLGRRLLHKELISTNELTEALARQTTDLLCEALRWNEGTFRFDKENLLPEARLARLQLPVQSLILEGVRRIDEWRLIESRISDFSSVFSRTQNEQESNLSQEFDDSHKKVWELIDGKRDLRSIIDASSMSSFDVCKAAYQLLDSNMIQSPSMH